MDVAYQTFMRRIQAELSGSLQSIADAGENLASELIMPPGGRVMIHGLEARWGRNSPFPKVLTQRRRGDNHLNTSSPLILFPGAGNEDAEARESLHDLHPRCRPRIGAAGAELSFFSHFGTLRRPTNIHKCRLRFRIFSQGFEAWAAKSADEAIADSQGPPEVVAAARRALF